jgi:hypothetical protein
MSSIPPTSSPAATTEALSPQSKTITNILNKLAIVGLFVELYFHASVLWISAWHFTWFLHGSVRHVQGPYKLLLERLNLPPTSTNTLALTFIILTLFGLCDVILWLLSFVIGAHGEIRGGRVQSGTHLG